MSDTPLARRAVSRLLPSDAPRRSSDGFGARPSAAFQDEHHTAGRRASTHERPAVNDRGSVAIVHDYLNQRGGAERVVLEMASMWPDAPIYTSLYRPQSTFPAFKQFDVHTSFLNRLPVDRGFRNLFPLYSAAFRAFGRFDEDLVLSSSSAWAHGVITEPDAFHVVYCHTPARWLYGNAYLGASRRQRALGPVLRGLRWQDCRAARRADLYIANSRTTQERIRRAYGIDAALVHPPVDIERFRPRPRGERLLVVSRLLPYKRIDVVVDAATRAGLALDVVGDGPALEGLRDRAGPTVAFHGRLPDDAVTELMQRCRAFCLPGVEDFGMTPVEANAAGKPVVAFAAGGALETLADGVSGAFFHEYSAEAVLDAVRQCDEIQTPPEQLAIAAERFSRCAFRARLLQALADGRASAGAHS